MYVCAYRGTYVCMCVHIEVHTLCMCVRIEVRMCVDIIV